MIAPNYYQEPPEEGSLVENPKDTALDVAGNQAFLKLAFLAPAKTKFIQIGAVLGRFFRYPKSTSEGNQRYLGC